MENSVPGFTASVLPPRASSSSLNDYRVKFKDQFDVERRQVGNPAPPAQPKASPLLTVKDFYVSAAERAECREAAHSLCDPKL